MCPLARDSSHPTRTPRGAAASAGLGRRGPPLGAGGVRGPRRAEGLRRGPGWAPVHASPGHAGGARCLSSWFLRLCRVTSDKERLSWATRPLPDLSRSRFMPLTVTRPSVRCRAHGHVSRENGKGRHAGSRHPRRGFPEVWGGWFRTLRLFPAQRHPDREPRCGGTRFNLHGEGGSPEPPRMAAPGGGRARPGPTRKRQRDTENRFASFPFTETPPLSVPRDETLSPAPALAQLDAGQARSARSARGSDGPGPHPRYQSGLSAVTSILLGRGRPGSPCSPGGGGAAERALGAGSAPRARLRTRAERPPGQVSQGPAR